jgi:DNA-binding transcriptional MerR regulator
MNDFLHQLRSGHSKQFDRNRKNYDNPQYRGHDNRGGRDRKNTSQRKSSDNVQLNTIKRILDTISENQKSMTESSKRRAVAEERIARVLEDISTYLQKGAGQNVPDPAINELPVDASSPSEATPDKESRPEPTKKNDRGKLLKLIERMRDDGASFDKIARHLEKNKISTLSGRGHWRGPSVSRLFYQEIAQKS